MDAWVERLEEIATLSRHLSHLDVIDIAFETEHVLEVYVALSAEQRSMGLSGLVSLDTAGMLFCFDTPTYAAFSMKDMLFDLDIAWYDNAGKMIQSGSFTAGQTTPLVCSQAFSYVLEVPAGTLPLADLSLSG